MKKLLAIYLKLDLLTGFSKHVLAPRIKKKQAYAFRRIYGFDCRNITDRMYDMGFEIGIKRRPDIIAALWRGDEDRLIDIAAEIAEEVVNSEELKALEYELQKEMDKTESIMRVS